MSLRRKSGSPTEPPSDLIQKFANLVNHAIHLDYTGVLEDFTGGEALPQFDPAHLTKLDHFVTELREDRSTQNHIILLKNELLKLASSDMSLSSTKQAEFFETLANNPQAIALLIHIRNDLYGPDGQLLKKILLGAAHEPVNRKAFLAGQDLGSCIKKYPDTKDWWHCVIAEPTHVKTLFSSDAYGTLLLRFSQTKLKQHLDQFSELTGQEGRLVENEVIWASLRLISLVDYASLRGFHQTVKNLTPEDLKQNLLTLAKYLKASDNGKLAQIVAELGPDLKAFGEALIKSYSGKTFAELNSEDLHQMLVDLSLVLSKYAPPETGPVIPFETQTQVDPQRDIFDEIQDIQRQATQIITETHIRRLSALIEELMKDPASEENLIQVKNAFLDAPPEIQPWSTNRLEHLNSKTIRLLLKIRDSLYGPDGQLLKEILLGAANNLDNREVFFAGQIMGDCTKQYPKEEGWWFPMGRCVVQHLHSAVSLYYFAGHYGTLLINFADTPLKQQLEEFAKLTGQDTRLDAAEARWTAVKLIKIVDYESLDWLHEYLQEIDYKTLQELIRTLVSYLKDSKSGKIQALLSEFGPRLQKEGLALFESFTGQSLRNLDAQGLHQLLEKLDAFLLNEEYGAITYLR